MKMKFLIRRLSALLILIPIFYIAFNLFVKLMFLAMYKGCELVDVIIVSLMWRK